MVVFYFSFVFPDILFVKNDGGKHILVVWQRISWYKLSSNRHPAHTPELINKIAWQTHLNCHPREWLWVPASWIATTCTREFNCECSRVWLRLLECSFASTCEYSRVQRLQARLACGQSTQKFFPGGVNKVCSRPFKMWLVGLIETETFFSEA